MYASGARICDISDKTGVPMRTISHIIRNKTYIGIHTASGIEIPVPNIIDKIVVNPDGLYEIVLCS